MYGSECRARMQAYFPKIVALGAFDSTLESSFKPARPKERNQYD
jgi:hypothetical protein